MNRRRMARAAGAAYLFIHIAGAFSEGFVRGRLTEPASIGAHETLYRWGVVAAILTIVGDSVVAVLFYELFKPVSKIASLLAASLRLVFVAVMLANAMLFYAPLVLMRAGKPDLVAIAHRIYSSGFNIANVFFAIQCAILGYLIARSKFLPRWLGALLVLAGVLYFTSSLGRLLAIDAIVKIAIYLIIPAGLCELTMTLWLLIVSTKESAAA